MYLVFNWDSDKLNFGHGNISRKTLQHIYLYLQNELVQLRDKLTTQLDLIKQAKLKQSQRGVGLSPSPSKPNVASTVKNITSQESFPDPAKLKEKDRSTSKALSLSLGPSMAMSLASGSIPPTIITPPTIEQPTSIIPQPPVSFSRQV